MPKQYWSMSSTHLLYIYFSVTTLLVGTTVAGLCNGTAGSTNDALNTPRGIAIINNGTTLTVAEEGNKRVQTFSLSQKSAGSLVLTTSTLGYYPSYVMAYHHSFYVTISYTNLIQIWPSNSTLPPSPPYNSTCTSGYLNSPSRIDVDNNGNI